MGIEGSSGKSPEREQLVAKYDKAIVSETFQLKKLHEARRRFLKTDPTDEQKIIIDTYLAASDRIENLRDDLMWVKALLRKECPDEKVLIGWEEKEIIFAEQKDIASSENGTDNTEEVQKPVAPSLNDLIANGEPVAEANARINELFTLEKAKVESANNALAEFQDKVPEALGEEVEQIIYQAMDWKKLAQNKKIMEALIDYPKLSVEDIITIFDRIQES